MTYYNQLRDFVMEDRECAMDLVRHNGVEWVSKKDLSINHILAILQKNNRLYSHIFWDILWNINFLTPLSEQEEVCEQILNFLKG